MKHKYLSVLLHIPYYSVFMLLYGKIVLSNVKLQNIMFNIYMYKCYINGLFDAFNIRL